MSSSEKTHGTSGGESSRLRHWGRVTYNRLRQFATPERKIFIIGPHRCATTTISQFFANQGLRVLHWQVKGTFLAKEIDLRKDDPAALKRFLSGWTVYSDFMYLTYSEHIENHTLYKTYERLFPKAYFIFNDRSVDRWVSSRLLHRDGKWLERYLSVHGGTKEDAIAKWKQDFHTHRVEVLEHFKGNPRFVHFPIDKPDGALLNHQDVQQLADMLKPDYDISAEYWRSFNIDRRPKGPSPTIPAPGGSQ